MCVPDSAESGYHPVTGTSTITLCWQKLYRRIYNLYILLLIKPLTRSEKAHSNYLHNCSNQCHSSGPYEMLFSLRLKSLWHCQLNKYYALSKWQHNVVMGNLPLHFGLEWFLVLLACAFSNLHKTLVVVKKGNSIKFPEKTTNVRLHLENVSKEFSRTGLLKSA